jgi:hypothetical protein
MLRGLQPLPQDGSAAPTPLGELARSIWEPTSRAVGLVLALAILLGFALRIWLLARSRQPHAIYRSALVQLAMLGVRREHGESREAFARRVAVRLPSLGPLTAVHAAAAWGGRVDATTIEEMRTARRTLKSELARSTPWWRRALGTLDPFSWLLAR